MKMKHGIFGVTALIMGLCGCEELAKKPLIEETAPVKTTETNEKTVAKADIQITGQALKLDVKKHDVLEKSAPVVQAVKEAKAEEHKIEQIKVEAEERVLYQAKQAKKEEEKQEIKDKEVVVTDDDIKPVVTEEKEPVIKQENIKPVIQEEPEQVIVEEIKQPETIIEDIKEPEPVVETVIEPEPEPINDSVTEPVTENVSQLDEVIEHPTPQEPEQGIIEEVNEPEPVIEEIKPAETPETPVLQETLADRIANEAIKLAGNTPQMQCTEFASLAMQKAGVHNAPVLWPDEYTTLGVVTTDPVAGDLIYYNAGARGQDHIAIYIGNNQAVHGNWMGTAEEPANSAIGSADIGVDATYIHVVE